MKAWRRDAECRSLSRPRILSRPVGEVQEAPLTASQAGSDIYDAAADVLAGNAATTSYSVMVDKTAPIAALTGGPTDGVSHYFGAVPAAPTCAASDALSGLAGCTVSGYSTAVGPHTVIATATDIAGNVKTASATYTVLPLLRGDYHPD